MRSLVGDLRLQSDLVKGLVCARGEWKTTHSMPRASRHMGNQAGGVLICVITLGALELSINGSVYQGFLECFVYERTGIWR